MVFPANKGKKDKELANFSVNLELMKRFTLCCQGPKGEIGPSGIQGYKGPKVRLVLMLGQDSSLTLYAGRGGFTWSTWP